MEQKCENCNKIYPNGNEVWYEHIGIRRGDVRISPGDPYPELPYIKLCSNCYEKLNDQEKSRWQIRKEPKTKWTNLPKHKTEWKTEKKH